MTHERLVYWQRRLGRIRLGAEPVSEQLAKYRRVTLAISAVALGIGAIIIAILTAFRAPAIGAAVAFILFGPMIALAWWDYSRLQSRVRAYEREIAESPASTV